MNKTLLSSALRAVTARLRPSPLRGDTPKHNPATAELERLIMELPEAQQARRSALKARALEEARAAVSKEIHRIYFRRRCFRVAACAAALTLLGTLAFWLHGPQGGEIPLAAGAEAEATLPPPALSNAQPPEEGEMMAVCLGAQVELRNTDDLVTPKPKFWPQAYRYIAPRSEGCWIPHGTLGTSMSVSGANAANEYWELATDIYLGFEAQPMTAAEIEAYRDGQGNRLAPMVRMVVTRVMPGSPAAKAGMRVGDLILVMRGMRVTSQAALMMRIRTHVPPGEAFYLRVIRDGENMPLWIEPEQRTTPALVSYRSPGMPQADELKKIRPHQIRIARLLAQEMPPLAEVHAEMDAIRALLGQGSPEGKLRLTYCCDECDISVIRHGDHILVAMEEWLGEFTDELRQEGDSLPPAMLWQLGRMFGPQPAPPLTRRPPEAGETVPLALGAQVGLPHVAGHITPLPDAPLVQRHEEEKTSLYEFDWIAANASLHGSLCISTGNGAIECWDVVSAVDIGMEARALSSREISHYTDRSERECWVQITKIEPGGPAERAGLREGDLLLTIDGLQVKSHAGLLVLLRRARAGARLEFRVRRCGKPIQASLVPDPLPAPMLLRYRTPGLPPTRVPRPHQMRVAALLAQDKPPLADILAEAGAIRRLLEHGNPEGYLRLTYCSADADMTVLFLHNTITVTLEAAGKAERVELRHEGDVLPEHMRKRLGEILAGTVPPPQRASNGTADTPSRPSRIANPPPWQAHAGGQGQPHHCGKPTRVAEAHPIWVKNRRHRLRRRQTS